MKRLKNILFVIMLMAFVTACSDEKFLYKGDPAPADPTVSFELPMVPASISEDAGAKYEVMVSLSEAYPFNIDVYATASGTATEGSDFVYDSRIVINAGSITGIMTFEVLSDEIHIEDTESVTLTYGTSQTPNAIVNSQSITFDIENGPPASEVEFTLWWEFANEAVDLDICTVINDLDLTWQTQGSGFYDDDLASFSMATRTCPETGSIAIADMNNGEVYDAYIVIFSAYDIGALGDITVHVDFNRGHSGLSGSFPIEGLFNSSMAGFGYIGLITIERNTDINGDIITIKDADGNILGEG